MKRIISAVAVLGIALTPGLVLAKNGSGPGSSAAGGNSGGGTSGGTGNANGVSHSGGAAASGVGGGNGGNGGHGGGSGGSGGNGGSGGGAAAGGAAGVSGAAAGSGASGVSGGASASGGAVAGASAGASASVSASTSGGLVFGQGYTTTEREQVHRDARACDPMGDISFRSNAVAGSFSYGGLEFHLPTFTQCMQDKGYAITGVAGRNALTDFGGRNEPQAVQGQ